MGGSLSQQAEWTEPTCIDNSGLPTSVLQTHRSGDTFNLGSTQVSYICSDAAGNQETCDFTITGKMILYVKAL